MAFKKVRVFANCDMTFIAWQTTTVIPECRGFAVLRETSGAAGDAKDWSTGSSSVPARLRDSMLTSTAGSLALISSPSKPRTAYDHME